MAERSTVALTVPGTLAGERLDRAIAALAPQLSRGEARRLIAAGSVFVEGRRTRISSRPVHAGQRITWDAAARSGGVERVQGEGGAAAAPAIEPRVVVEHRDLWILDKPAGMPVEPTRTSALGTLTEWLRRGPGRGFVTHRLDAATSGLLVVARNAEAQAALNRMFAAHEIGRRYLAVVAPPPPWERVTLDAPLDGRAAVTHATVVARSPVAAALSVALETGRTRQIRRHLAAAGHPVVGETAAGHRQGPRLLLHAAALDIPWRPVRLFAAARPPADFLSAATTLALALPEL